MDRANQSLSQQISRLLVDWFHANRRDLPWRNNYEPYSIWVAEMMLQQTQAERVVPYYLHWMKRFPTIESITQASGDELYRLWEGLGYYPRVQYIYKTAHLIQRDFGGQFPTRHSDLLRLPGIGPYTAGAIMSIAYNQNYPLVDGNITRIITRIFDIDGLITRKETRNLIWKKAEELILPGHARFSNQALMELGALICTPKNPNCPDCPIREFCLSLANDCIELRPVVQPSKKVVSIEGVVGVLHKDGYYFIQQRPPGGLMAGLWEFPGGKIEEGEKQEDALVREFREELDLTVQVEEKITILKHNYTSFSVTLNAYYCRLVPSNQIPKLRAASAFRWVKPHELGDFAFPSANRRLIKMIMG